MIAAIDKIRRLPYIETKATDEAPFPETMWSLLAGFRFFLASVVVFSHEGLYLPATWNVATAWIVCFGSFQAVAAFFVISGFSIAASLERDKEHFIERRIWRIAPIYLASFILAVLPWAFFGPVITTAAGSFEAPQTRGQELGFVLNAFCLQGLITLPISTFGQSWSLGCEVWYYAFAPLFAKLTNRNLYIVGGLSLLAYIIQSVFFPIFDAVKNFAVPIVTLLFMWLVGFEFYRKRNDSRARFWMPFILVVVGSLSVSHDAPWGAFMMIGLGLILAQTFNVSLTPKQRNILNFSGAVSYPLYLSHIVVIAVCSHYIANAPGIGGIIIYLAAVIVAVLLIQLIDRPATAYHRWRISKRAALQIWPVTLS